MESDAFYTLAQAAEALYREKGSRFLAYCYPTPTEAEVQQHLAALRKKHPDATHHCYAWVLGTGKAQHHRANDDGEPNGTAGLPILNQIRARQLANVLVVVVRYFGGTKLGASGLVQTYKAAAAEVLDLGGKMQQYPTATLHLAFAYLQTNEVMRAVKESGATIVQQHFDNACTLQLQVRRAHAQALKERLEKLPCAVTVEE